MSSLLGESVRLLVNGEEIKHEIWHKIIQDEFIEFAYFFQEGSEIGYIYWLDCIDNKAEIKVNIKNTSFAEALCQVDDVQFISECNDGCRIFVRLKILG